jgi:Fur family ferric uptake transcriptional regulator
MQQTAPLTCRRKTCRKPDICADRLASFLSQEGGRFTRERSLLLQVSCEAGAHFTPDILQKALLTRGVKMAMTTIYRNLPALERAGIIRRTTFGEEDRNGAATYEHVWGRPHHDHLMCQACGKRIEFEYEALEVLQEEVARKHGFRLTSHHLELVGICPDCEKKEQAARAGGAA